MNSTPSAEVTRPLEMHVCLSSPSTALACRPPDVKVAAEISLTVYAQFGCAWPRVLDG